MIRGRCILLVQDDCDELEFAMRAFELNNMASHIVVARDGQEAVDYIFAQGTHAQRDPTAMPDLVLLDLNLPKLDGLEILRRIRKDDRTNRLPVVVLTSSREESDIDRCYDLGANSFVRKPLGLGVYRNSPAPRAVLARHERGALALGASEREIVKVQH